MRYIDLIMRDDTQVLCFSFKTKARVFDPHTLRAKEVEDEP